MARNVIGVGFGNAYFKVAVRDKGVEHLYAERLDANMMDGMGHVTSREAFGDFIKEFRSRHGIGAADVAVALNSRMAYFRHVSLPPMTVDELDLNLPYEFRDYVEGDPQDYVYDYAVEDMPLGPDGEPTELSLIAVATRRDVIDELEDVLTRGGLRLRYVFPSQVAHTRLLKRRIEDIPTEKDADAIVIDLGSVSTELGLYHGDIWQASRVLDAGCGALNELVAELKGVDYQTADRYVIENFESVLDAKECLTVLYRVADEVSKVVNFYNYSNPDMNIRRMYLLGGGAQIDTLVDVLAGAVSVPTESVANIMPSTIRTDPYAVNCALAYAAMLEAEAM